VSNSTYEERERKCLVKGRPWEDPSCKRESSVRWQVDEFLEENQCLVVAEVERPFGDVEWPLKILPEFIGQDLTDLPENEASRYFNSRLVRAPYRAYPAEHRAIEGSLPHPQVL
jgi:hypothetical protein